MTKLIIGAGVGGWGIAHYLELSGLAYHMVDDDPAQALSMDEADWLGIECAIVSAGVGEKSFWLGQVKKRGLPLIGEAQFALERMKNRRLVALTGTNGKTTLALFAAHVLRAAGFDAQACGNVGLSLGDFLCGSVSIGVVELSSFQLERLDGALFESALILDITPDHLDRHGSFRAYAAAKGRLCSLVKEKGALFISSQAKRLLGDHEAIYFASGSDLITLAHLLLTPFGLSLEQVAAAYKTFKRPEHRLEEVGLIDGVRFINDSKATNFAALKYALNRFEGEKVSLILSGIPKEDQVPEQVLEKAAYIVAFGEMARLVKGVAAEAANLQSAVQLAFENTPSGGVVLFSPGGSSFDCFENYIDRGKQFKYTVEKGEKGLVRPYEEATYEPESES